MNKRRSSLKLKWSENLPSGKLKLKPINNFSTPNNLNEKQLNILRIISKNNDLQFQILIQSTPERLNSLIEGFEKRIPIIEDLKKNGIDIPDLSYLADPKFNSLLIKAAPILVKWLKKNYIDIQTKTTILHILIENPSTKEFAFEAVIEEFNKIKEEDLKQNKGFNNMFVIMIGNAFTRWMDDAHANVLFRLLSDNKYKDADFLISSSANLKKTENREMAIEIIEQKLKESNLSNSFLIVLIGTLRKLKAIRTKSLIEPFTEFPKNYKRIMSRSEEEHGYTTDAEVRNEAKKTIEVFNKTGH